MTQNVFTVFCCRSTEIFIYFNKSYAFNIQTYERTELIRMYMVGTGWVYEDLFQWNAFIFGLFCTFLNMAWHNYDGDECWSYFNGYFPVGRCQIFRVVIIIAQVTFQRRTYKACKLNKSLRFRRWKLTIILSSDPDGTTCNCVHSFPYLFPCSK